LTVCGFHTFDPWDEGINVRKILAVKEHCTGIEEIRIRILVSLKKTSGFLFTTA